MDVLKIDRNLKKTYVGKNVETYYFFNTPVWSLVSINSYLYGSFHPILSDDPLEKYKN